LLAKPVAVNRETGKLGARAPRAAFGYTTAENVATERTSA
jgi:hypothetical protein